MGTSWSQEAKDWFDAQPRVKFVCGRDWMYGPDCYQVGVYWRKTKDPVEGCTIYERWWSIRFTLRAWVSRSGGRNL